MAEKLAFGVEPSKRRYHLRLARYPGMVDAVRAFREKLATNDDADRSLALLDIGAAQGRTLKYLKAAGLDEGITFHGMDNEPKATNRIFEADRWHYRMHDAEQGLPYEDGAFDIVICEQVLEHLHRADFVLSEIGRVLRPGGIAILGVPSFPPGLAAVRRHIVPHLDRLTDRHRGHVQVFTQQSFVKLIRQTTDLEVERVQAFRCISGGVLAPLENLEWWYRLNRRAATALSHLAIEIQVIARQPTAEASEAVADPSRRRRLFGDDDARQPAASRLAGVISLNWQRMRDRLVNTSTSSAVLGIVLTLLAVTISTVLLSDQTSRWLYADGTGVFEKISVWLWLGLGVSLVALWRTMAWWRVAALAGTCLLAGVIEGRWYQTWHEQGSAIIAVGVVLGLATLMVLFHLLRQSRGLREGWVQVLLIVLAAMGIAEAFDQMPGFLHASFGIVVDGTAYHILRAGEEGLELLLPVLLGVAALAWAHAQASRHAVAESSAKGS
ncbi:class I SAM-dependent methyltransferase [Phycisphaerales bacterium AB-hyl4]|uniref:Class I SAM-dependent methyltransferase n=1 Tax=Natronomicrosphaera hydrolytica TaxID=3242702 RepID=A0ABV4U7Z7_9BACT